MLLNWLPKLRVFHFFKSIWILKVKDNLLLGKTKKKEQSELHSSWTKMLLNRTTSKIFEPYVAESKR